MKTGKESEVKIEKLDSMRISLILKGGHLFGTLDDQKYKKDNSKI